jgi:NusA N-terminal domain
LTENSNTTHQLIKKLAEREGVPEEKIEEIIIDSFHNSYCQGENVGADLHFEFDTGLSVYRTYKIVEKVNNPEKEIEKDSKLLKKSKVKDDTFFLPLDIKKFSFSLSSEIRRQLKRDLGGIKEERQCELFKPLERELVRGNIQSYQENYYVVNLGKGFGH